MPIGVRRIVVIITMLITQAVCLPTRHVPSFSQTRKEETGDASKSFRTKTASLAADYDGRFSS